MFLPGESHGQRSLVGYSPWTQKESDTTQGLNNSNNNHLSISTSRCHLSINNLFVSIYHLFILYCLSSNHLLFYFKYPVICVFILPHQVLAVTHRIFSCSRQTLSCRRWDLVPWPETKPRPPELGARSLSYWTTKEFPIFIFWDSLETDYFIYLILATPCGCGILVPWPGIEPMPSALEAQSLSHSTTREVPIHCLYISFFRLLIYVSVNV